MSAFLRHMLYSDMHTERFTAERVHNTTRLVADKRLLHRLTSSRGTKPGLLTFAVCTGRAVVVCTALHYWRIVHAGQITTAAIGGIGARFAPSSVHVTEPCIIIQAKDTFNTPCSVDDDTTTWEDAEQITHRQLCKGRCHLGQAHSRCLQYKHSMLQRHLQCPSLGSRCGNKACRPSHRKMGTA